MLMVQLTMKEWSGRKQLRRLPRIHTIKPIRGGKGYVMSEEKTPNMCKKKRGRKQKKTLSTPTGQTPINEKFAPNHREAAKKDPTQLNGRAFESRDTMVLP